MTLQTFSVWPYFPLWSIHHLGGYLSNADQRRIDLCSAPPRRVYADAIALALTGKDQQLQRMVVVRLDQYMVRFSEVAVGDGIDRRERRINGFTHAANDNKLLGWKHGMPF